MIIVADTSPLNYLVQVRAEQVLPALYGRIIVPPQVLSELCQPGAPTDVRRWASAPPAWLEVKQPNTIDRSLPIDEGEAAAIALACELNADRLLIDERAGRDVAQQLGIPIVGTLAVLKDAALAGLLDLPTIFQRLKQTSFRASPRLYAEVLKDYERHRNGQ